MRSITHRAAAWGVALCALSGGALAQPAAGGAGRTFVGEYSKDVSLALFSDTNTWRNLTQVSVQEDPPADGQRRFHGASYATWIHDATFFHYRSLLAQPSATDPQFSGGRGNEALAPGQTWSAKVSFTGLPANWCADLHSTVSSSFKVEKAEPYTLKLDGSPRTLQVLPIVERGTWTRCYSGKRYTRFLYAPEIDTVVSIEHVGYTPEGRPHESSYRFNVTEIQQAPAK